MNKEFKIAKILDEYNVVINAGTDHNIDIGDKFQILDKKGSVVKDPETDEIIGQLDLIKATVIVKETQEKMCICSSQTHSYFKSSVLTGISAGVDGMFSTEQEKLNIDNKQMTGGLRKSNEKIRVGDVVNLIKSTK